MTVLSAKRDTQKQVGDPIPANICRGMAVDIGYKGGMAAINAAGYMAPAGLASTDVVVGRFLETYDNSAGGAGDINGTAEQGVFGWANSGGGGAIANDDTGKNCYAVDDATVSLTDGAGAYPFAGVVMGLDPVSSLVMVLQGVFLRPIAETYAVSVASKSVGYAVLTDADMQQTVAFDAALPAGAMVIGAGANVTAVFDNAGDTASLTFDLGDAGDPDGYVDGGSLDAVAKVAIPRGVAIPGLRGAVTPSIIFDSSVNLNTLTKGAATFYVAYVQPF